MNSIDDLIETISLDKKQAHQIKTLFKTSFLMGMAFNQNIPDMQPTSPLFENVYQIYLLACGADTVEAFNCEMKAFEKGQKTDLI